MARLEFLGKVERIGETTQVANGDGSRTFYRRELIIDGTIYDPYTREPVRKNHVAFEFGGDKCAILDGYKVGDLVVVNFALQGVNYEDKATKVMKNFTKVVGYDIRPMEQQQPSAQPSSQASPAPTQAQQPAGQPFPPQADAQGNQEDLPF